MIKTNQSWPKLPFILGLVNMGIIWLLFFMMYITGIDRTGNVSFDIFGLSLSVLALVALTLAVFRDFAFKSAPEVTS